MNSQVPTIPDTKSGTLIVSSNEAPAKTNLKTRNDPTREEINDFLHALLNPNRDEEHDLPWIEVDRKIIEHYNKGPAAIAGFESAGFFVFQNVQVFQEGRRKGAEKQAALSMEEVNFGKSNVK